jgi:hypothetical protein
LEFPVLWSNDPDTRFDPFKGSITNLKELARIRWAMFRGRTDGPRAFTVRERVGGADAHHSAQEAAAHLDDRAGLRGTV